jgi:ABC-type multidrug transport system ATPase subunit
VSTSNSDVPVWTGPPVLSAASICHSYGDRRVLQNLSLTVNSGERVAIVGENGAGKTTLMQICARLLTPQ